jgi:hypothetical protein
VSKHVLARAPDAGRRLSALVSHSPRASSMLDYDGNRFLLEEYAPEVAYEIVRIFFTRWRPLTATRACGLTDSIPKRT